MAIDPRELDELLGAYALDAVEPDERRMVEAYLEQSPRARAEVHEHREVATMLAFSGASAPDGLWDRIAASLDERPPAPGPELAKVMPMRPSRRSWALKAGAWAAASVAAAAIAVVVVRSVDDGATMEDPVAAAVDQARNDRDTRIAELTAPDGAGDVTVEAVVDQDGHGYVLAADLPALAADRTYQLWGVVDEQVISLGVLGHNPETEAFSVEGDLTALVITEEQAGGVPVSEQPPLLAASLA